MTWRIDGPQGKEAQKIKYLLPRYTRGKGLDIGCGTEKAFPHFIGVDNGHHFGTDAADVVCEADDLSQFEDGSMDFVFSSHALEHMPDMQKALNEWGRVIKPGGCLCLYVPSANLYPICGEPGANPDHKHDIYPGEIPTLMAKTPYAWDQVIKEERDGGNEYSLFEVYRKISDDALAEYVHEGFPRGKTVCICRFGGFGDMLQTAAILPRLKEQGYHVTIMTTPKGQGILQHDPHVDDWYIVDTDQVPNGELNAFWKAQAKRFTKFINLSESIEGHLLAMPGRINHSWPHEVRKKRLNANYMDWTAELAGVQFKACQLFYPSRAEFDRAEKAMGDDHFDIVWALAGSSCHKVYPHQDAVIARVMLDMPEARIFLVGDFACKLLEQGWELEKRIIMLSGEQEIRDTLTMAVTSH
jgi:SAM-dependent methyltransferase